MKNPNIIQRALWSAFGKPASRILEEEADATMRLASAERDRRIAECATWGIPYSDAQFWPAFYVFDKKPIADGIKHHVGAHGYICPGLYDAKHGDIVPVFEGRGILFMYRVNGFSRASGDDHIVSPWQFDISFVRTEAKP